MKLSIEIMWVISIVVLLIIIGTDFAYEPKLFNWSSFTLIPWIQEGASKAEIAWWNFLATYGYDAIEYVPIAVFYMITG